MNVNTFFYALKPYIPRKLQVLARRVKVFRERSKARDIWPIDPCAVSPPENWNGWPNGKSFALILTHDVDTPRGRDRCGQLAQMEARLGFRSSFNFVPERYRVFPSLRRYLECNGFEVGVHGLYHDGKLYKSKEIFLKRAIAINRYMKEWNSVGFRSPAMHHNLDWIHDLEIEYDCSTFDTDPFEPQPTGTKTIFPFFVENGSVRKGYVELSYTLPQDYTLFILMGEKNIDIWKRKLGWIVEKKGMVLLNTHPDYMTFGKEPKTEEYPADYYEEFLQYVKEEYANQYWHVLPKRMAGFYRHFFDQYHYRLEMHA